MNLEAWVSLPIQRCQVLFATPTDNWAIFMGLAAITQNLWVGSAHLEQQLETEQNGTWNGTGHLSILGTFVLLLPGEIQFKIKTLSYKRLEIDVYLCFWCVRIHCNQSRFTSLSSVAWMSSPMAQDTYCHPAFPPAVTPEGHVPPRSSTS